MMLGMVNLMVYCKLKEKRKDSAVYDIGASVEDMTGQVVFYRDLREPEIIKQPEKESIRMQAIARVYGKYRAAFASGEFKEKLSYEIG